MRDMSDDAQNFAKPRGYDAWLAVVKNYQKCHRILSQALQAIGITVAQHEVLIAIGRADGLTQQDLADRLLVVKSNVTGLLQRLESQGLVRRTTDRADARNKRLSLTTKGRRIAMRSFALQAEVVEMMMGTMDDRELEKNRELSLRVSQALDERLHIRADETSA